MNKKDKYSASILVIGDEILSGRTQDTNSNQIAKKMTEIGINISDIRVVPDTKEIIIESINELRKKTDYLFTTGGIGPTHDDITAESIASAFGVEININQEAFSILKAYYDEIGSPFNEARQRMAMIPVGATLIDNPISKAPGFKLENVFVFAGIPKIMIAMLENSIKYLEKGKIVHSKSIKVNALILTKPAPDSLKSFTRVLHTPESAASLSAMLAALMSSSDIDLPEVTSL